MNPNQNSYTITKHARYAAALLAVLFLLAGLANAGWDVFTHSDQGTKGYVGGGEGFYGGNAVEFNRSRVTAKADPATASTGVTAVVPAYEGGGEGDYGF